MKKIALLTWHHVQNYGTALQAFALSKAIEKLGGEVDLINYNRKDLVIAKNKISMLSRFKKKGVNRHVFNRLIFDDFFNDYFSYTERCYCFNDLIKLNNSYNGFVCGSDQIWGPEWFNPIFFLNFVCERSRKIAYAPSIGVKIIKDKNLSSEIAKLINDFSFVSVREKTGCELVSKMLSFKPINAIDPVFLLDKEEWKSKEKPINNLPNNYAIIFFLKNNEKKIQFSIKECGKRGLTPLVFHSTQSEDNDFANFEDCSVPELLYLIHNSKEVFTDSFHITVLSIIYGKIFFTFLKNRQNSIHEKNSRIIDLLSKLDIQDRIVDFRIANPNSIDYDLVSKKVIAWKEESLLFLKNAIDSLPNDFSDASGLRCPFFNEKQPCDGKVIGHCHSTYLLKRYRYFFLEENCYGCSILKNRDSIKKHYQYYSLVEDCKTRSSFVLFCKYFYVFALRNLFKRK